jgi:hypothetical protein
MNPLTEARLAVADAIKAAVPGINVYSAAPEVVTAPAVLLMGGTPWARPLTYTRTEVSLTVTILATQGTNEDATRRLEQIVWDAVSAIRADTGGIVGPLQGATLQTYGTAQYAAVEFDLLLHVDDSQ